MISVHEHVKIFDVYAQVKKISFHIRCKVFFLGEKGRSETSHKKLSYKGCVFHRIVKDFMIQAGDFIKGKLDFDRNKGFWF